MKYLLLVVLAMGVSCPVSDASAQQVPVPRVEQMPRMPTPYAMRDWKAVARGYDAFVFDVAASGTYLPLVWIRPSGVNYPSHPGFGLHTVVGTTAPTSGEAINALPALVGASLVGIDKRSAQGRDWVLMAEDFFNRRPEEAVYLNHPSATSGSDWWYDTMPNVFFYQLYDLYRGVGSFDEQFRSVADRWLAAVRAMGGSGAPWRVPEMGYRAWALSTMTPRTDGVPEPEAAGAIAWLLYGAYLETGELAYRSGAEWALEYLDGLTTNPSYELQLPYGVLAAARMNAEQGTTYDVEKMVGWVFDVGPLRQWGTLVGTWGGYDIDGLVGEATSNGYAFSMNTFQQASTLVPLVRYDDRFARAVGRYVLNAANAARLFYYNHLPEDLQDSDTWARVYDPEGFIAHEGLRQYRFGRSPYATGDAVDGGWGRTNLALYSSSHVGYLAAVVDTTDVPYVLRLDTRRTDFFQDAAYPTFLYYNPHTEEKVVEVAVGEEARDVYDAVANRFVAHEARGRTAVTLGPDAAAMLVLLPAGGAVTYEGDRMLVNGIVADYRAGRGVANHAPRIKGVATAAQPVRAGSTEPVHCTAVDRDGDALAYTWRAAAGTLTGTGAVTTWTAPAEAGRYAVTCGVTDGAEAVEETALVRVVQSFPVIQAVTAVPKKVDLGGAALVSCEAEDPAGGSLTYAWSGRYGAFEGAGRSVEWQAPGEEGDYYVVCRVTDAAGAEAADSVAVIVRDFSKGGEGTLVAHYTFDGNAQDASGHGHHGAVSGARLTTGFDGKPDGAYRFDGADDVVRVGNTAALNFGEGITLSFWMQVDRFFNRESYPISHGNWETRWKVSLTEQRLRWTIKTADGVADLDSETLLETGRFYHVAVRYDGHDLEVYLDGVLDAYRPFSGALLPTTYDLTIGQVLPGNARYNFAGVLDDVRLYDYALSVNDIRGFYVLDVEDETPGPGGEAGLRLLSPYPNPSSGSAMIGYETGLAGHVVLHVYDLLGRRICRLVDAVQPAGYHEVLWDGRDDSGRPVAPGAYFYELQQGAAAARRMLIRVR